MKTYPSEMAVSELFHDYSVKDGLLDEVFRPSKDADTHYDKLLSLFSTYSSDEFGILNEYAKKSFLVRGVTFTTYSNNPKGNERIFPHLYKAYSHRRRQHHLYY